MKRSKRFSRTLEFLKTREDKRAFFNGYYVLIYSGEHGAFWRANAGGYTADMATAGVYEFKDAWAACAHAGKEKRLSFQILSDEDLKTISRKYSKAVCIALHGTDEEFKEELCQLSKSCETERGSG